MLFIMIESFRKTGKGSPEYEHGIVQDAWVIAEEPTSDELDVLVKELGVERDLLQDARDPNEVPRVQEERGVVYVFMRIPQSDGERMVTVPVLFALGERFLLTVWGRQPTFMERYLGDEGSYSTNHRSQLLLKLWQEVNGLYQGSITEISRLVRATMGNLSSVENTDILRLVTFEGVLNDFLAALVPMNAHLGRLLSGKQMKMYAEDEDLYEDVLLQSGQLIESSKSVLKTTVNYRNAYSVIANNNLNRVVKLLTAATVILTIPTGIFSFYGMNVSLPFGANPLAWLGIISVTIVLALAVVVLFARNRWL